MSKNLSRFTEGEIVARAAKLLKRHCQREGLTFSQPCKVSSSFNAQTLLVELANARGPMAQYRLDGKTNRLRLIQAKVGA